MKYLFENLKNMLSTGENQVKEFIVNRLILQKVSISETIRKNNFSLLKSQHSSGGRNGWNFGVALMNKLHSAVEHRSLLADSLFAEELYGVPHCFATDVDVMYHGTKSSIKDRLKSCSPPAHLTESTWTAIVLEASPLIRKLSHVPVESFHDFSAVLYQHISKLATGFDRVDIIFDRYFKDSLKRQTRIDRGVSGTRFLKINFQNSFLRNADDKNDLGEYLAPKLIAFHCDSGSRCIQFCVTFKDSILHSANITIPPLISNSEEADQRIVRHALNCIDDNYDNIVINSIDYDVLILLISCGRKG